MSSTYRIICLSHDPGIALDAEWSSHHDGHITAASIALVPHAHEETALHVGCDLVVGRYSSPLIEVCCPGGSHKGLLHPSSPRWVDVGWLRLLSLAYQEPEGSPLHSLADAETDLACWPKERLGRLRRELGIDDGPAGS